MSYNWNIPKKLAKSEKLTWREKLVVAVCLQYYNAGFPNNANRTNIKNALHFSRRTMDAAINGLVRKNLLDNPTFDETTGIRLNHQELLNQKLVTEKSYNKTPTE